MTCTVTHYAGGKTIAKGTASVRPMRWEVSVWFVLPSGEKSQHSLTIPAATVTDLVPVVGERIDELVAELGNEVREAAWTAHGRGQVKGRKR